MHTLTVAKTSFVLDDTELTDQDFAFACRVFTLLRGRTSSTFWSYVRLIGMTLRLAAPGKVTLGIRLELFIPQAEGVTMEMSIGLIDDPLAPKVAVATMLSYIEDLLRMRARDIQDGRAALYQAARIVRK